MSKSGHPCPQTYNQLPTLCPWQPERSAEPRSTLVQVTDTPGSDSVPAYLAHVSATASYVTHSQPVPAPLPFKEDVDDEVMLNVLGCDVLGTS